MKVFFHLFFFVLILNGFSCKNDTPLMSTVKTVSKEIDTSCIVLLHTVHQMEIDSKRIMDIIKSLAMDFVVDVTITAITFKRFVGIVEDHDFYLDCTSPITLIIHDDEETRSELLQVSTMLVLFTVQNLWE